MDATLRDPDDLSLQDEPQPIDIDHENGIEKSELGGQPEEEMDVDAAEGLADATKPSAVNRDEEEDTGDSEEKRSFSAEQLRDVCVQRADFERALRRSVLSLSSFLSLRHQCSALGQARGLCNDARCFVG